MEFIKSEQITYPLTDGEGQGYLAKPDAPGPFPGVVVIQEWWGLVPHIEDVTRRFAAEGFVALAPDLYHGETAQEPDEARKLALGLELETAVKEIMQALLYLQGRRDVTPKRIGLVGFCLGGMLTYHTAAHSDQISAAVVFYGSPRDEAILPRLQAPLLGLYGAEDHGIPVESVRKFERIMQEHNIPHEVQIYQGTGHAFFNDARPHIYQAEAAGDAWARTLGWLRKGLIRTD